MASKATLAITGMHCASCAAIITRKLTKTPGVSEVNVNYAAAKANVLFDPGQVQVEGLIDAIRKAGYDARIAGAVDRDTEKKHREMEIRTYKRKFLWGLLLSTPMLYFMAGSFVPSLPLISWVTPWMGIASLLLSSPVQFWLGAGFYHSTWSAMRMKTFNMDSLISIGPSTAYFYSLFNVLQHLWTEGTIIGEMHGLCFEVAAFLITF